MPSPDKLAAFHVGAHKTGTSVLQHFLRENPALLRRLRVLWVPRRELAEHIGWGKGLRDDPAPLARRVAELRRSPRSRILIASYENLLGRPFRPGGSGHLYPQAARNMATLAEVARPVRAKAVLAIRPTADFLESYYLQTVHQGGHETFERWLDGVDLDRVSWLPVVAALDDAFGPANVEVVDFRLIAGGQEAYLRHMLARIDPRLDVPISHDAPRNRSLSARGLQLALAANPALTSWPERAAMRDFLQAHFSNLHGPRPALFTPAQRLALDERYGPEYEDLVATRTRERA